VDELLVGEVEELLVGDVEVACEDRTTSVAKMTRDSTRIGRMVTSLRILDAITHHTDLFIAGPF